MNELALFAGAGGGLLGGKLLGWRTVCAVEWEPYAACVLAARQNDGFLPPFPIWDDIQTFDGRPWRGIVDVISGGFPCQDISAAGKGAGIEGERSGMWRHMARVVSEVRPRFVFVENSPMLTSRGGTRVVADLAKLGYDTRWTVMGAADVGAPHQRDRFWLVGYTAGSGFQEWASDPMGRPEANSESQRSSSQMANSGQIGSRREASEQGMEGRFRPSFGGLERDWWSREPESTPRIIERGLGRVAHGVAARVDRLKAIGNGQVPLCAATAFRELAADWLTK